MDEKEKAINVLYDLLNNPPPDVDLTLVGGSALILWTNLYREAYPENFEANRIAGTQDIDFITYKDDVLKCHEYWGGNLIVPGMDHATPELAILCVNPESKDESVQIDFLMDLVGISRDKSLKGREHIMGFGDNENIYFLSEIMTLMNRVMNTLLLTRYQNTHAFDQIYNAMAVVKSAIMAKLDTNDAQGASRLAYRVLDMARTRRIGVSLFVKFGIDLLDAVIINDDRHVEGFTNIAQPKLLHQLHERRKSRVSHLRRRGYPEETWWPNT